MEEKEKKYKEELDIKEKEIVKLQAKIKLLNSRDIDNKNNYNKNDNSINNVSNKSRMMKSKSKINSTLYTISQDEFENNNKYKFDEFNNIYKDNLNEENMNERKNITMLNFRASRNHNYFSILNKKHKKNNMSQQNSLVNIKPYCKKNFNTNQLKKNNKKKNGRNNSINLNSKKKELRKKILSNSFMNITSNTFNLNKNSIMINLNPKNINMNIENLKVKKKLHEYQKLIDQKLNQLIKKHHPNLQNNKTMLHIRRNSSPSYDINNKKSQQKNSPLLGVEYYIKKINKKNTNVNSINNSNKILSKSIIETKRTKVFNKNIKNNKSNSKNITNMKLNLNKVSFNSKISDLNSSRQFNESILTNEKSNLSLKKYIFAKCSNSLSNTIKS